MDLDSALAAAQEAFRQAEGRDSEGWEAAVLDAANGRRAFRRLDFGDEAGSTERVKHPEGEQSV
jgi:hypothetical protein